MKQALLAGCCAMAFSLTPVYAEGDWSGNISLEGRYFPQDAVHAGQVNGNFSLSLQPEYRNKWDNDHKSFTFIPFYRWDSKDNERSHGDIRQLDLIVAQGDWEFQGGISKVFWGVTESQHLVDIINQTDGVENLDGEDKLGQPMLRISRIMDEGSISLFVLPYFRERTFPGLEGRLRTPLPVDTGQATYESDREEKHVDYALRWNQTFDNIDLGLSWFDGTSRQPDFRPNTTGTALNPHYPQIQQAGLDLQYTGDAWLWKLEAIHRSSGTESYNAAVGGFEYTIPGITDSGADLGLLAEYHFDSRDKLATSPFQNDIFIGTRLAMNDTQSTELLAGAIFDLDYDSKSFRVEAGRRLSDNIKINLEAQAFTDIDPADPLYAIRNDDHLLVELQRFF
jgi:hypothetical protein